MVVRTVGAWVLVYGLMTGGVFAQDQGSNAVGVAVEREVKGLTADEFAQRQAAARRLQALLAGQLAQAATQPIAGGPTGDLAAQDRALAVVTDVEAQAQVAGLLEMQQGLAAWTIQTLAEPLERRKQLLAWGLGDEGMPAVAKAYSGKRALRLQGVQELAKLPADGASWTLARLINDGDAAVRAAAMAVAWKREANSDLVGALWFRAVSGPGALADQEVATGVLQNQEESIKVAFPEGAAMVFPMDDDAGAYTDAILAGDVLLHLNSPLVDARLQELVARRALLGKNLIAPTDPDWTLVTHRLVEAYRVKEAVPMLAAEALGSQAEEMAGTVNGRPYSWSARTLAVGALATLLKQEPSDFQLIHVNETGELRGYTWGVQANPRGRAGGAGDAEVVRAFYAWWKAHHTEYGVKEEPSAAYVPAAPATGPRGR